ncbi:DNA repair protein XRCC1 isoform X2 [Hypomesus transpacificus]|uniref:DNA repair protein XRCC1 isoform X2 n=1 Tax=Hypomesus transpacificus TaxID=137520 RepID=UPI001F08210B|nr:DNA repair protein XRCC1 isoform X2 [Hypomesus transpacificus]
MLFERVQDPKSTVGNLFDEDAGTRSWLCNPHDHSGVLKAELQLEHTTCIRYIDLGNCGSAFIQIDVGRSSWPPDHPYTTLLPTTTLMSPAESRQGTVRTGVRMFKKGDFLSEGAEDSWDRVRVTCSQPFNRRSQFGLSFLRIRSAKGGKRLCYHSAESTGRPLTRCGRVALQPGSPENLLSGKESQRHSDGFRRFESDGTHGTFSCLPPPCTEVSIQHTL